jgi:flagellar basal-body rod modification protein FlgD
MKNQDPMNPMQGDQMAAQLAQFSSLEQLTQMNQTLSGQHTDNLGLLGALQTSAGIGAIGHTVIATGNELAVGPNGPSSVTVDVSGAGTGTLTIYDSNGTAVGTRDLGALVGGNKQSINLGSAIDGLPPGTYTYGVTVKDSSGNPVSVTTYMSGRVDGVQATSQGIVLTSGGLTIPYSSVVQIIQ